MSVSFCLPHPVEVSAFMICSGVCACTDMLWMCVLYLSLGSKVITKPLDALPWVWREQSASCLSGFSKRLFCFVQEKPVCGYGCTYLLAALVLESVDVMVTSSV